MNLLSDVNLNKILISSNGREITLDFIDMEKGEPISSIFCNFVYFINYQNIFSNSDGFACYIGEVNCYKVPQEKIKDWLSEKKYKFTDSQGFVCLPSHNDLIHLQLEGGEVAIDLLCEKIKKNNLEINL